MCTHTNHQFNNNECLDHCCSNQLFVSKRKKLEILNKCLNCLQVKEEDVKEAITELEK
jgi:hypothetical protein